MADTPLKPGIPADKQKVGVQRECIGCRTCEAICPKVFYMRDNGIAATKRNYTAEDVPLIQEAIDACPVNTIHWGIENEDL